MNCWARCFDCVDDSSDKLYYTLQSILPSEGYWISHQNLRDRSSIFMQCRIRRVWSYTSNNNINNIMRDTTECVRRRERRDEEKKEKKKGNGEATQYLMILDRSNDFPSQQRRYSLSHSHQWICVYENVRAVKFQLHRSTERCKEKKGMKNYNSFYVKRCDGRRGKIKVQIPIVFFSVFFPLSSFHFFAALVSYTNILLQCSFSSSLRCALSGHRKTYPITRP